MIMKGSVSSCYEGHQEIGQFRHGIVTMMKMALRGELDDIGSDDRSSLGQPFQQFHRFPPPESTRIGCAGRAHQRCIESIHIE